LPGKEILAEMGQFNEGLIKAVDGRQEARRRERLGATN
jgi:hypothetical protein